MKFQSLLLLLIFFLVLPANSAQRMIDYRYANCVACHVNPQGRGILTDYGNSVDEAQSLRSGEYKPQSGGLTKVLNLDGKMLHDIRAYVKQVTNEQDSKKTTEFQTKVAYRNTTSVAKKHQVAFAIEYRDPNSQPFFVDQALWKYRPVEDFELAFGRDQLPTGLNDGDNTAFIHAENGFGSSDRPNQMKAFWWAENYLMVPYIFAPSGEKPSDQQETGYGVMAERDLYDQRYVVGLNGIAAESDVRDRQMAGAYSRFGFGKFGLFLEYDYSWLKDKAVVAERYYQETTYAQIFWTPEEWIATAITWEQLKVSGSNAEQAQAYGVKAGFRFTRNLSLGVSGKRTESPERTDTISVSLTTKF